MDANPANPANWIRTDATAFAQSQAGELAVPPEKRPSVNFWSNSVIANRQESKKVSPPRPGWRTWT
jgi:hypothetical protein